MTTQLATIGPRDAARFWRRTVRDPESGCWIWTGARTGGYGRMMIAGKYIRAHVLAFNLLVGPIPAGLDLDHLCRDRGCTNPACLEPVTRRENLVRGNGTVGTNSRKRLCKRGHPLDAVYRGVRQCKTCHAARERERQRARREAA